MFGPPFLAGSSIDNPEAVLIVAQNHTDIGPVESAIVFLAQLVHVGHIWSVHISPALTQVLHEWLERFEK